MQPDTLVPEPGSSQGYNRYTYVNNNPINYADPSGHLPDWAYYAIGAYSQFFNDMTFGFYYALASKFTGDIDYYGDDSFQQGREAGRTLSTAFSVFLVADGAATALAGSSALAPTAGIGGGCAALTGGGCLALALPVLGAEAGVALAGAGEAAIGATSLAYIKNDPLKLAKGTGNSSTSGNSSGNPAQMNKLTPGEIRALEQRGFNAEDLKANEYTGQWDIFKDKSGNLFIKPKSGTGPGEPLNLNIKEILK
ncbi:MAG: polymorphic toxin type 33 domain-containing protein [Anaerolineaceae bacterium]|nr:polymorphic toxin type 33 domain-containing protein [Anaerolineaceae bacterium]